MIVYSVTTSLCHALQRDSSSSVRDKKQVQFKPQTQQRTQLCGLCLFSDAAAALGQSSLCAAGFFKAVTWTNLLWTYVCSLADKRKPSCFINMQQGWVSLVAEYVSVIYISVFISHKETLIWGRHFLFFWHPAQLAEGVTAQRVQWAQESAPLQSSGIMLWNKLWCTGLNHMIHVMHRYKHIVSKWDISDISL